VTVDRELDTQLAGAREESERRAKAEAALERTLASARSRILSAAEYVTAHRGAVGADARARLADGTLLVTPSGVSKGGLAPQELLVVDLEGRVVRGEGRPSTELRMHLAALAARPDAGAAVHAHPITAVALTVAGLPPPNDLVPEAAVTLGEVALAPFATPGTDEVPASLAPLLASHDVVLLERHGALALGRTLGEAFDRIETLERVARIALVARLLGRAEPLPAAAIEKVLRAAGRPPRR
jgi:L-fuculose-phosphate aldolase